MSRDRSAAAFEGTLPRSGIRVAVIILYLAAVPARAQTFEVFHAFSGDASSQVTLIEASDGGGAMNAGTVFRSDLLGAVTTLREFSGTDGDGPQALLQDSDGKLYGTTFGGGGL